MKVRTSSGICEYPKMNTGELRSSYLLENLFAPGKIQSTYWETDRAVISSIVPLGAELKLSTEPELASTTFFERREAGVLNLGGPGTISVDGTDYELNEMECLYIGRGCADPVFTSKNPAQPAKYYLISYPAHCKHPTSLMKVSEATQLNLGRQETANVRTIYQYIHEKGLKSCQLVMGLTRLDAGSVWNTMPPHTHLRRSEIYLYFNIPDQAAVFHFMGQPEETRSLVLHNDQAVLSPPWSIHSGCGTAAYSFVWAMGGENQRFDDMDPATPTNLK